MTREVMTKIVCLLAILIIEGQSTSISRHTLEWKNSTFNGYIPNAIFINTPTETDSRKFDCVRCSLHVTDKFQRASQSTPKFLESARLVSLNEKYIISLQDDILRISNYFISEGINFTFSEHTQIRLDFPFSKTKAKVFIYRADGINSGNYLIIFKGRFCNVYKEFVDPDTSNYRLELISSNKLPFASASIKRIFHNEQTLVILLKTNVIFIGAIIDKGELVIIKKIDESYLFPEASETLTLGNKLKILDAWPIFDCRSAEEKPLVKSCFPRSEKSKQQSRLCHVVADFCMKILIIEPLNSKDKSSLDLCYKDLIKRKNMRRTKLQLSLQNGIYKAWDFHGLLIKLVKGGSHFYLEINKKKFELSDIDKPHVLYSDQVQGVFMLALLVKNKVHFYRVFQNISKKVCGKEQTFKPYQIQVYSSVISDISIAKIDQERLSLVPFFNNYQMYFVTNYKGLAGLYKFRSGHFHANCSPTRVKKSFIKCDEKLNVSYVKLKNYLRAHDPPGNESVRKSWTSFQLTWVFYKIDLLKSLGFVTVLAFMTLMFYLLRSKSEKRALNRYKLVKKKK
jgi:hypothetical protein